VRLSQGDIVALELPFTDLSGSKLRPALVLNAKDLAEDVIVAKITGTPGKYRVKIEQRDLLEGKLKKMSYVDVSSIFTIEKKLIKRRIGRLREEALGRVKEELRLLFGL
jgi:mRNA interferase MazF